MADEAAAISPSPASGSSAADAMSWPWNEFCVLADRRP
jgi:hypothetical protein